MKKIKFPSLSRRGKVLRNLMLTLLFGVIVWGATGFYISNPVLSFRRAERANWVGPSEIQGTFRTGASRWCVGIYRDRVLFHRGDGHGFSYWLRGGEEITLIPVPGDHISEETVWVLAVDVPPEAVSARMELTTACWYSEQIYADGYSRQYSAVELPEEQLRYGPLQRWEKTYTAQGEFLEEGGVLFCVTAEDARIGGMEQYILSAACDWDSYAIPKARRRMECAVNVVFYDRAGLEIARAELITPE